MKAAIYARYSSENQRESSLEDQERPCREEAACLGGHNSIRTTADIYGRQDLDELQKSYDDKVGGAVNPVIEQAIAGTRPRAQSIAPA
jgi:hypothetical protein